MPRFFISYRRTDTQAWACGLYDALRDRFGCNAVFLDIDSIGPGDDFRSVLAGVLDVTHVVLVLIGPAWFDARDDHGERRLGDAGDLVRIEVATALVSAGVVVVPVLVDGATMPEAGSLPVELRELTRRNAMFPGAAFTPEQIDALGALAASVDSKARLVAVERQKRQGRADLAARAAARIADSDPELALLILLAALDKHAPTTEVAHGLQATLRRIHQVGQVPAPGWRPDDDVPLFIESSALTPDGACVVTADRGTHLLDRPSTMLPLNRPQRHCMLRLWTLPCGQPVWQVPIASTDINDVAVCPSGGTIAAALPAEVILVDSRAGERVGAIEGTATHVAYSRDGSRLAVARSGEITLFDATSHAMLETIPVSQRVQHIDVDGTGSVVAVRGDRTTQIWHAGDAAAAREWPPGTAVAFGSEDRVLIAGDDPFRLEVAAIGRDAGALTLSTLKTFSLERQPSDVLVSGDGSTFAAVFPHGTRVWPRAADDSHWIPAGAGSRGKAALSHDGALLLEDAHPLRVYETQRRAGYRQMVKTASPPGLAFFRQDASLVVVTDAEGRRHLAGSYAPAETVDLGPPYWISAVAATGDVAFLENPNRIAHLDAREPIEVEPNWGFVAARFSWAGDWLGIAGYTALMVTDTATAVRRYWFGEHDDDEGDHYSDVAVSAGGRLLASGSLAGARSALWEIETGKRLFGIGGSHVAFTPDDRSVLAALDDSLWLVDTASGDRVADLQAEGALIQSIAISPTGREALAVAGGRVQLWTLPEGKLLDELDAAPEPISGAAFSTDGRAIATTSSDGVRLWDIPSIDEIYEAARARVFRHLTPAERERYGLPP